MRIQKEAYFQKILLIKALNFFFVYITNYLHFITMFLSFKHLKTLKTITKVKTNF